MNKNEVLSGEIMRKILFRGKRIDTGEWVYGDFRNTNGMNPHNAFIVTYTNEQYNEVIPETVGQCTDLKDIYDKDIFEGDVIALNEDVKKIFDVEDGEVRYGWGGFYVKEFSPLNSLNTLASYDCILRGKVIGNIHDNPELLNT